MKIGELMTTINVFVKCDEHLSVVVSSMRTNRWSSVLVSDIRAESIPVTRLFSGSFLPTPACIYCGQTNRVSILKCPLSLAIR